MTEFRASGVTITTKNNMNNVALGNKIKVEDNTGKKILGIVVDVIHLVSKWENHQGIEKSAHKIVVVIDDNEKLNQNSVWNSENVAPKYNLNGITDFIVSSAYGHIEGEAHTYTPEQWSAHLGFNQNREFRWAYEKDLI